MTVALVVLSVLLGLNAVILVALLIHYRRGD